MTSTINIPTLFLKCRTRGKKTLTNIPKKKIYLCWKVEAPNNVPTPKKPGKEI